VVDQKAKKKYLIQSTYTYYQINRTNMSFSISGLNVSDVVNKVKNKSNKKRKQYSLFNNINNSINNNLLNNNNSLSNNILSNQPGNKNKKNVHWKNNINSIKREYNPSSLEYINKSAEKSASIMSTKEILKKIFQEFTEAELDSIFKVYGKGKVENNGDIRTLGDIISSIAFKKYSLVHNLSSQLVNRYSESKTTSKDHKHIAEFVGECYQNAIPTEYTSQQIKEKDYTNSINYSSQQIEEEYTKGDPMENSETYLTLENTSDSENEYEKIYNNMENTEYNEQTLPENYNEISINNSAEILNKTENTESEIEQNKELTNNLTESSDIETQKDIFTEEL